MPAPICVVDKGGYNVQPGPGKSGESSPIANSTTISENINNHSEILLSLGKAISDVPNCKGSIKFPKPPIKIGMTEKKIIIKPCMVIDEL